jgi:tRNA threonylcarbamoyladenosine modification (KEOPS) complex  Pcc1 subunit
MTIECTVSIEFKTQVQAQHVLQSIQLDDEGFVQSSIDGNQLQAAITAPSVSSLLHTLDDYLACVTVAQDVVQKKATHDNKSPA